MNSHLDQITQTYLTLSDDERKRMIYSGVWISYPIAKGILKQFDELLTTPKISRMPNILLYGDSNNGKTELLKTFDKRFEPRLTNGEGTKLDVLLVEAPPKADENRLYTNILKRLNLPQSFTEHVNKKSFRVEQVLKSLELKILIVDELHNIITAPFNKQREFLTVIKSLSNELQICLIVAGTREARTVINTDDQLANRFMPIELPRWELNKDFLQMLVTFESKIPLHKSSRLIEKETAIKLFAMSEGLLGELAIILKKSAILAIDTKEERITIPIINSINYKIPSQRRRG